MPVIRVQYKRTMSGAPPVGKWGVYSQAHFQTAAAPVPSATQLAQIQRLFLGMDTTSTTNAVLRTQAFNTATGGALVTVWERTGGSWVKVGDYPVTVPLSSISSILPLPQQTALAVGYRAAPMGPPQRGRSRWFLGPGRINASYTVHDDTGGLRLSVAGVDRVVLNASNCLAALAAEGWSLRVASGRGELMSFWPAVELYCDDVLDVMRSRRAWQTYQARQSI